jgi:putative phosphoribosyl transferase
MVRFADRRDAGRQLAARLQRFKAEDPLVLALPRGGLPVGYEVARALGAPLDVLIVRKLGAPMQPELGVGAVAEGGALFVDQATCDELGIPSEEIEEIAVRERAEIDRRVRRYRGGRGLIALTGRTVILVDDGVATGGTARTAIRALRALGPRRIVFAVPVAAVDAAQVLATEADELVAVSVPESLMAIGFWYRNFDQVDDAEVVAWLERAARGPDEQEEEELTGDGQTNEVGAGEVTLEGNLTVPRGASGVVLFAHGSGSSRFSPRNRYVASVLQSVGLATLLMDLLTEEEEALDEQTGELRFDIDFLAARVAQATDWLRRNDATSYLKIGYFGSSTGAAAALVAAAARPDAVAAVVSRGGRPDLAAPVLPRVRAPTLLIVGSDDHEVLTLNREALEALQCEKQLEIVSGATHLFEEPGTLERVAELAAAYFSRHLATREEPARI